jgi:hypothetical protein
MADELEPSDEHGELDLPPIKDRPTRWDVTYDEITKADPEQLRHYISNMNDQIRRLYELRRLEMDLGRSLTKNEIDFVLHSEKAGTDDETADR